MAQLYLRLGRQLHLRKPVQRLFPRSAAHLLRGLQSGAKGRSLRLVEHPAVHFFIKLNTGYTGWLALRHAGQGRSDGRGDAAGGAVGSAIHERDYIRACHTHNANETTGNMAWVPLD
jgi:hypothetical protein